MEHPAFRMRSCEVADEQLRRKRGRPLADFSGEDRYASRREGSKSRQRSRPSGIIQTARCGGRPFEDERTHELGIAWTGCRRRLRWRPEITATLEIARGEAVALPAEDVRIPELATSRGVAYNDA